MIKRTGDIGGIFGVGDDDQYGLGDFYTIKAFMAGSVETARILADVAAARANRSLEVTPTEEDAATYFDWISAIQAQTGNVYMTDSTGPKRDKLVELAATVAAMIESLDRQTGGESW